MQSILIRIIGLMAVIALPVTAEERTHESCNDKKTHLFAAYEIIPSDHGEVSRVNLYRKADTVVHQFPNEHYSMVWDKQGDQYITKQYFDGFQEGVESSVDVSSMSAEAKARLMSANQSLITESFLASLHKVDAYGEGCDRIETYHGVKRGVVYNIDWRPALSLIEYYQKISLATGKSIEWELYEITHERVEIESFFLVRDGYRVMPKSSLDDSTGNTLMSEIYRKGNAPSVSAISKAVDPF